MHKNKIKQNGSKKNVNKTIKKKFNLIKFSFDHGQYTHTDAEHYVIIKVNFMML